MASPSFDQYFDAFRAQALIDRPDLSFDEGDVSEMDGAGGAAMADRLTGWAAGRIKALFLDGANGTDLDVYGDDRYGIQRQAEVKATGQISLTRPTAAAGGGTVAAGSIVATARDSSGAEVRFTTNVAVVFGAAELTKTVAATAEVAGVGGNVAIGAITRVVSTLFDLTIVVANAARFAGGAEEESDDEYRERIRSFPFTLRRGTEAALVYGALLVPQVTKAAVITDSSGAVVIYVTDSTGASNAQMVALATAEIEKWAAEGALWTVTGGVVATANIVAVLTVRTGVDVNSIVTSVVAAITARVNKLTISETLYLSAIQAAIFAVSPDIIEAIVTINGAAANLAPTSNQIVRPGTVSAG